MLDTTAVAAVEKQNIIGCDPIRSKNEWYSVVAFLHELGDELLDRRLLPKGSSLEEHFRIQLHTGPIDLAQDPGLQE